jgi:hypothetical protein
MRIQEERERRDAQARNARRMPAALRELYDMLADCVGSYTSTFGRDAADVEFVRDRIRINVREQRDGKWQQLSRVEITGVPELPGFHVQRDNSAFDIEIGILPSDGLTYRDREMDCYLTVEDMTRKIMDRVLFPGLPEQ